MRVVRSLRMHLLCYALVFFFNDTATTEIYTLSLHDALPIACPPDRRRQSLRRRCCSPTRPGTAFRARLPLRQCLSASQECSRAFGQVTRPLRAAAAPSRCADRPARAARPPRGAPPSGPCSDNGGPGRCAAGAEDGGRPPRGRGTRGGGRLATPGTPEGASSSGGIPGGA